MNVRSERVRAGVTSLFCALVLLAGSATHAAPIVRVLLEGGQSTVSVEIDGPHEVRTARGVARSGSTLSWPLAFSGGEIHSRGLTVGAWIELVPDDGVIQRDGRAYRGGVRIEVAEDGLRVINLVDLEAYLRGVVPSEMSAVWPLEALKAQAVAARSYTLAALDRDAPYDICASDRCQVYRGMAAEHPRSDAAIAATEGIVITWQGSPAVAYYHSDSGGIVASSAEVWGRALPYLLVLRDVPASSPHRGWTVQIDPTRLASALAAEGESVGTPTRLTILDRSGSGRVSDARVDGSAGSVRLTGPTLARTLRAAGLRSTRFDTIGPLQVRGDGWGHGVGMSQYGARAMAAQGFDYGRILAYYYPGVGLQRRIYRASP